MMKTTKFGTLFLISIMALAGVTAGYAIWGETLTIDGAVTTGEFDVNFIAGTTGSDEAHTSSATIEAAVIDSGNTMTVTILGAYPEVTYYVNFEVSNDGTVPAEFDAWTYTYDTLTGLATLLVSPTGASLAITATTLLAGETWTGELEVTLNDSVTMNTLYTFEITLNAYQTTT